MSTVDERIVKLELQNGGFEGALKKSRASLSSFFSGLSKLGSSNNLDNVTRGAQNASKAIATTSDTAGKVSSSFNALKTVATGALLTIGSQAVQQGTRLLKSFTLDPVMDGFNEYQLKMKSIGIISANTGEDMSKINDVLSDMNDYADKTIYSFSDMTTNMGYFTAAGIDLKTSAEDIKGLSNLAAYTGTSATDASRAMYQLSQSLSSGRVALQDWKSVEAANMGGKKFQKSLEATAVAMGHGRDMTVSFRDSLQDGWLTTEVLNKTLAQFAGDKDMLRLATQAHTFEDAMGAIGEAAGSGFANMWESLIGGYDESTRVWTGLQNWGSKVVSVIPNYFEKIGKAMRQTASDGTVPMGRIVKSVKSIGDSIKTITAGPIGLLKRAFKSLGDSGLTFFTEKLPKAFEFVASILAKLAAKMGPLNNLFAKLGDFIAKTFRTVYDVTSKVIGKIVDVFRKVFTGVYNIVSKVIGKVTDTIKHWTVGTKDDVWTLADTIKSKWETLKTLLVTPFTAAKGAIDRELKAIQTTFTSTFGKLQSPIDDLKEAWGNIKQIFVEVKDSALELMKVLVPKDTGLWQFIDKLSSSSTDFFDSIKPGKQQWIKDTTQAILDFTRGTLDGAKKLHEFTDKVVDWIDKNKILKKSLEGIKKVWDDLKDIFKTPVVSADEVGGTGKSKDGGLGELASNVRASKDPIGDTLDFITGKFKDLQQVLSSPAIQRAAITFASIVIALKGISVINKDLTAFTGVLQQFKKDTETLMGAIKKVPQSISGMFTSISTAMTTLSKGIVKIGLILAWAKAILELSQALDVLAGIPTDKIISGVVAIAAMTVIMAAQMKLMSMALKTMSPKAIAASALGLLAFAGSISVLAGALVAIQHLDIVKMAAQLAALTLAIMGLSWAASKNPIKPSAGLGLASMALAMVGLAASLAVISRIPMGTMVGSIIAVAGVLAALSLASKGINGATAAAIVALAGAMIIMAVAIAALSNIKPEHLAVGLLGLAAAMGIMIGSMALLSLVAPEAYATAGALALFGVAVLALGAGLLAGAVGLAVFGVAFATAAAGLVAGVGIIIAGFVQLAPMVANNAKELALMILVIAGLSIAIGLLGIAVGILGIGLIAAGAGLTLFAVGLAAIGIAAPIAAAGLVTFVTLMNTLKDAIEPFLEVAKGLAEGLAIIGLGALAAAVGIGALGLAMIVAAAGVALFGLAIFLAGNKVAGFSSLLPGIGSSLSGFIQQIGSAAGSLPGFALVIGVASIALVALAVAAGAAGIGIGVFGAGLHAFGAGLAVAGAGVVAFATDVINSVKMILDAMGAIPGVGKKFREAANDIDSSGLGTKAAKQAKEAIDGINQASTGAHEAGKGLGKGASDGITEGLGDTHSKGAKGGSDAAAGLMGQMGANKTAGQNNGKAASDGVDLGLGNLFSKGTTKGGQLTQGFGQSLGGLNLAGLTGGQQGSEGLDSGFGDMFGKGNTKMQDLVNGMNTGSTGANAAGQTTGQNANAGLDLGMGDMFGKGNGKMQDLVSGITNGSTGANTAGQATGQNTSSGIDLGMGDMFGKGNTKMSNFIGGITNGSAGANTAGQGAGSQTRAGIDTGTGDLNQKGLTKAQEYAMGVQQAKMQAYNAGLHDGANAKNGMVDGAGNTNALGNRKGNDMATGVGNAAGNARSKGRTTGAAANSGAQGGLMQMLRTGSKGGSDMANGVGKQANNARGKGKSVGSGAHNGAKQGLMQMMQTGRKGGSDVAQGIGGQSKNARQAGHNVGSSGVSGAKTGSSGAHGAGDNLGSSFVSGIGKWLGSAARKGAELAASAVNAVKAHLKIGSPSRVMKQIGRWTGEGLAIGMDQRVTAVTSKAQFLANRVTDAMGDIGSAAQDALENNLDMTPTITPVLDSHSIRNASIGKIRLGQQATLDGYQSKMSVFGRQAPQKVQLDTGDLDTKLNALSSKTSGDINLNMTVYGTLDDVTARRWAPTIAENLDKLR